MSDAQHLLDTVDALLALPAPDPAAVSALLGLPLALTEVRGTYEDYGGSFTTGFFSKVGCGFRKGTPYGMVQLWTRNRTLHHHELDLRRYGDLPQLDIGSPTMSDPYVSYWFTLPGGTKVVIFVCGHGDGMLREVVLRWQPVQYPPGEEPVFATAPAVLYIQSYDAVHLVLVYDVKERISRVVEKSSVGRVALASGLFSRERDQVAGYFATPEGPAFFHDKKRCVGAFGKTRASIERVNAPGLRRFKLWQASINIDLVYTERHGVGTNPYDTTEDDVDLFAFIAKRVADPAFYTQQTKPWPESAVVSP